MCTRLDNCQYETFLELLILGCYGTQVGVGVSRMYNVLEQSQAQSNKNTDPLAGFSPAIFASEGSGIEWFWVWIESMSRSSADVCQRLNPVEFTLIIYINSKHS